MNVLLRAALVGLAAGALSLPLAAEELATPKLAVPAVKKAKTANATASTTKPAAGKERRPGELEGWESGVSAPVKPKNRRPADAISERAVPDGGLPLPNSQTSGVNDPPPVGFDKGGNLGGMFRF